jgi:ferredoxin-NADP reductase
VNALADPALVEGRDIYAAGPPMLLRALTADLARRGIDRARLNIDSFGV